tara:strand:- start:817 stop:1221 length:405 start_codon:yes stop_codon:yes gene_type:complete
MPLITGKRRSPLDLNNNIKIGVAFPLDETNMFKSTETLMDQAKSNLLNLLLTYPGERVNLPKFGVGIKKQLFQNNVNIKVLEENIKAQSQYYVPNIKVLDVSIERSEDQLVLFVSITYKSLLDGTSEVIQLNFN